MKTIAVVGASPFAAFLAGLLAADHSRAVVLLGPPADPYRLRPLPALSLAPLTRPETWSLLATHTRRTVRRLARIAPGTSERIDMRLSARSPDATIALSHIHRTADGFRVPLDPPVAAGGATILGLRDVRLFEPALLAAAAPAWLAGANVAMLNALDGLRLRRDGTASFGATAIDQVVLADDAAILDWLDADEIAHFARVEHWLGVETLPHRLARYRAGVDLDTGAVFAQSGDGVIRAAACDDDGSGFESIAASLAHDAAPRLAARTRFARLLTHDGAPAFGPTRRAKIFVIAGLGVLDLVLAPRLAAIIAGAADGIEAEWAAAHGADLRQPRRAVAEFAPGHIPGGFA